MIKKHSVTTEILKSLIPYSQSNLKLAYKPGKFFNDLEKISQANRNTLAASMSRARRNGWIEDKQGVPVLTKRGLAKINHLSEVDLLDGWLLVVFDIPESRRLDRDRLRSYLKLRGFRNLQKSTWCTKENRAEELKVVISDLKLAKFVAIFIAASVFEPGIDSDI